ncbi:GRP family sugar transporter [Hoeflea marina]|nr:GRP family sugar transporter [Hoeflea marina]
MSGFLMAWLTGASLIFIAGAAVLRQYIDRQNAWFLVLALVLYSLGNLMMVRLMKENGMAVSMSVSAVLQLILVNLVAILFYGERPGNLQASGIALGIVAVILIVMPQGSRS